MNLRCPRCGYEWNYRVNPPKKYGTCPSCYTKVKTAARPASPADNRSYEERMADFVLTAFHQGYDMGLLGELIEALHQYSTAAGRVCDGADSLGEQADSILASIFGLQAPKGLLQDEDGKALEALEKFLTNAAEDAGGEGGDKPTLQELQWALLGIRHRWEMESAKVVPGQIWG